MHRVSAIVPAAGMSSRMGGPNKLLLPYGDSTVVGSVVAALARCDVDIVVVTGRNAAAVEATALAAARNAVSFRAVFNPDYVEGLGRSIALGVESCPDADGYLIALGDMPDLESELVVRVLGEFQVGGTDRIVSTRYSDDPSRPAHPTLFGRAHRAALVALHGERGARSILVENCSVLTLVSAGDAIRDVDLPGDLAPR